MSFKIETEYLIAIRNRLRVLSCVVVLVTCSIGFCTILSLPVDERIRTILALCTAVAVVLAFPICYISFPSVWRYLNASTKISINDGVLVIYLFERFPVVRMNLQAASEIKVGNIQYPEKLRMHVRDSGGYLLAIPTLEEMETFIDCVKKSTQVEIEYLEQNLAFPTRKAVFNRISLVLLFLLTLICSCSAITLFEFGE